MFSLHWFNILCIFHSIFTCWPPPQNCSPLVPQAFSVCLPILLSVRDVGAISSKTSASYTSCFKHFDNLLFILLTSIKYVMVVLFIHPKSPILLLLLCYYYYYVAIAWFQRDHSRYTILFLAVDFVLYVSVCLKKFRRSYSQVSGRDI